MMLSAFVLLVTLSFFVAFASGAILSPHATDDNEIYIVYLGALPEASTTSENTVNSHVKLLSSVKRTEEVARSSIVVSYTKSFNGFAAKLSSSEADTLKAMPGVVSVFPNRLRKLATTRSWDFVGLQSSAPRNTMVESNIVVGVLDTGVWPESQMFNNDTSFGPIPSAWKGECVSGDQFTPDNCNKKLIGAKYFYKGYVAEFGPVNKSLDFLSARDADGHGSHTASTAAGSVVERANVYGLAQGTARGAVPAARVAIYKVCWENICFDVDILEAMDHAISDGIDIMSVSIYQAPFRYSEDSIAIGAFHAVQRGILVSCAAGNDGVLGSVANSAPWIFTVTASTIDRQFYSPILLGNNVTVKGVAINTFEMNDTWYPLITGAQAAVPNPTSDPSFCDQSLMDETKVKGKIMYCNIGAFPPLDLHMVQLGAAGLVIAQAQMVQDASSFLLPTSVVGPSDANDILQYINSTSSPLAKLLPSETTMGQLTAPIVDSSSSRGPNRISGEILKPDISAPGIDILAAWSLNDSLRGNNPYDKQFSPYNIISGSSMATAHVSGASAYVKSFHPDWSPAAIKSALMTTATPFDSSNPLNSDLEFGYGAGLINPTKAIDPGLIYDIEYHDYVPFLCTHGYNSTEVSLITGKTNIQCLANMTTNFSLNYPTISIGIPIYLKDDWYATMRTLTYVGSGENTTYVAKLMVPEGMEVDVSPMTLSFNKMYEKQSFHVKMRASGIGTAFKLSASLIWESTTHTVSTPLLIWTSTVPLL